MRGLRFRLVVLCAVLVSHTFAFRQQVLRLSEKATKVKVTSLAVTSPLPVAPTGDALGSETVPPQPPTDPGQGLVEPKNLYIFSLFGDTTVGSGMTEGDQKPMITLSEHLAGVLATAARDTGVTVKVIVGALCETKTEQAGTTKLVNFFNLLSPLLKTFKESTTEEIADSIGLYTVGECETETLCRKGDSRMDHCDLPNGVIDMETGNILDVDDEGKIMKINGESKVKFQLARGTPQVLPTIPTTQLCEPTARQPCCTKLESAPDADEVQMPNNFISLQETDGHDCVQSPCSGCADGTCYLPPGFSLVDPYVGENYVVCFGFSHDKSVTETPMPSWFPFGQNTICDDWQGPFFGDSYGDPLQPTLTQATIRGPQPKCSMRRKNFWAKSELLLIDTADRGRFAEDTTDYGTGSILAKADKTLLDATFLAELQQFKNKDINSPRVCILIYEPKDLVDKTESARMGYEALRNLVASKNGAILRRDHTSLETSFTYSKTLHADGGTEFLWTGRLEYSHLYGAEFCTVAIVGRGAASVLEPILLGGIPVFTHKDVDALQYLKNTGERGDNERLITNLGGEPKERLLNEPRPKKSKKLLKTDEQNEARLGYLKQHPLYRTYAQAHVEGGKGLKKFCEAQHMRNKILDAFPGGVEYGKEDAKKIQSLVMEYEGTEGCKSVALIIARIQQGMEKSGRTCPKLVLLMKKIPQAFQDYKEFKIDGPKKKFLGQLVEVWADIVKTSATEMRTEMEELKVETAGKPVPNFDCEVENEDVERAKTNTQTLALEKDGCKTIGCYTTSGPKYRCRQACKCGETTSCEIGQTCIDGTDETTFAIIKKCVGCVPATTKTAVAALTPAAPLPPAAALTPAAALPPTVAGAEVEQEAPVQCKDLSLYSNRLRFKRDLAKADPKLLSQ